MSEIRDTSEALRNALPVDQGATALSSPIITIDSVGVRFHLQARHRSMRDLLFKGTKGQQGSRFWALKNVSFDVHAGEAIGVVGRNGSGKSTLLKIVAGVMLPDIGTISLGGGVAPLIEITGGFVPDLTARDNIYLAAGLHGMSRADIDERFDDIVDFAELRAFLDTPFKHLSSGMRVRLAFSVVSRLEEPILIVDEVLAVGDKAFREKCYDRITDLLADGRTLFFVSHSAADLKRFCRRGLYLERGRLRVDAPIAEVLAAYHRDIRTSRRQRESDTRAIDTKQDAAAERAFRDVRPGTVYHDDIDWLKRQGIVRGDKKGNFRPTEPVSRKVLATMLFRFRNGAAATFTCAIAPFTDVPAASVFAGPISWASQVGVMQPVDNGHFDPTSPASREVLAEAVFRLSNPRAWPGACSQAPFPDVPADSDHCAAITWLKERGIAGADDHGNFRPKEPASRQVLARFLHAMSARTTEMHDRRPRKDA